MKVALVQPKFDRSGGAERYAVELVRGLRERGHEVHAFGRKGPALERGVAFHRVGCVPLGRALKTWTFALAATRRVGRGRFDVVQGSGKTTCQTVHRTGGGLHRAYLARLGGVRRTLYDRIAVRLEDELFTSTALRAVLCPSRWVAGEVESFYPVAGEKIRVIPNGVDTSAFRPEGREADRKELCFRLGLADTADILLFVGTNFRLKGLDLAIDGLARLPGACLIVVGGDDRTPFQQQARELGVKGRVVFLGAVASPAPLYRAADVLVHPTRYDPFANVCLEAMACGTPVVTTEENGVSDLLAGGRGGAILPEGADGAEVAEAVRRMIEAGRAVREQAVEVAIRNDQSRHVAAVESLYRELQEGYG